MTYLVSEWGRRVRGKGLDNEGMMGKKSQTPLKNGVGRAGEAAT